MLIPFDEMKETIIPHFHGGEGEARAFAYGDDWNRIMLGTLDPGASIGPHTHTGDSEINYVLRGSGVAWYDGREEILRPGVCHYCPPGHEHGMKNTGDEPLVTLNVVSRHGDA